MEWTEMLGHGIYTVPEAARLTRVSARRIKNWLKGYQYLVKEGDRDASPVWKPDIPEVDGSLALSFRDLMEVQFVEAFLSSGVKWKTLRKAAEAAAEIIHDTHPFSTKRFKTDGRSIFLEIAATTGEPSLLELAQRQYGIYEVVDPFLFKSIEFGPGPIGVAERWHPLFPNLAVVVDPRVSFGQPTVEGIPTYIVASAAEAEESASRAAAVYGIGVSSVEAAIEFESKLAA